MSLFMPDYMFDKVWCISKDFLAINKIKALVLDVDNTLTTHGSHIIDEKIHSWIKEMNEAKIPLMIVSNNSENRVKPFAESISLNYVSRGRKPLTTGLTKASKLMKINHKEIALIGDQIFTDILGGNLRGMKTILVNPLSYEGEGKGIAFKRMLEKPFIRRSIKKTGGYIK